VPERLAFLLGKDPRTAYGGDVTMSGVLRAIAAERYDTELICLSDRPTAYADSGTTRVAKPELSLPGLALRSARSRRSLVHTRFDVDGVREAVERSGADRFVAIHAYMAEPVLRAGRGDDLVVSTEISEAGVWRRTRGPAGRVEARRLASDEWRVVRAARSVGGYDRTEMDSLRRRGIAQAHWLPVTLPPADPVDLAASPPRLVLLGNRTWGPNADAARRLVQWWPDISSGVAGAELVLVGAPPAGRPVELPRGVTDLGTVDDVTPVLAGCRALVAPIEVGGGVRVKVLEAAARGLPVVSTPAGVGAVEAALGLTAAGDRDAFVGRCRALLHDVDEAVAAGSALHAANARRWEERHGQDAVLRWLAA